MCQASAGVSAASLISLARKEQVRPSSYVVALQTSAGWQKFAAGWLVGGLSGVAWAYILTQTLPYYR